MEQKMKKKYNSGAKQSDVKETKLAVDTSAIQSNRNVFRNLNGVIAQLFESYGFIFVDQNVNKSVLDVCDEKRRIYFNLSVVKNDPFLLKPRSDVIFSIRIKEPSQDLSSHGSYEVFEVHLKYCRTEEQIFACFYGHSNNNDSMEQYNTPTGQRLAPITCDAVIVSWNSAGGFCHVKPLIQLSRALFKEDHFYLHFSYLFNFGLDLIPGDILSVTIDPNKANKMRVEIAVLSQIVFDKRRTFSSLYGIALKVSEFLNSTSVDEMSIVQKMSSNVSPKAILKLFSEQSHHLSQDEKMAILETSLQLTLFCMKHFGDNYNCELIQTMVSGGFFEQNKPLHSYILTKHQNNDESALKSSSDFHAIDTQIELSDVKKFLTEIIRLQPECGRKIYKRVCLYPSLFGYDFFTEMMEIITRSFAVQIQDLTYKEVKLVPTNEELQQLLVDERSFLNLSPVLKQGAYDSVESYIETYFNLLRYDCFFSLLVGIKRYLRGDLDLRDMNVAVEGLLWALGFENPHESTPTDVFGITAQLLRNNNATNLLGNRSFMFGNLVAISASGLFNDIIWATVFHRNDELEDGKITVYLEYESEINSKSFLEAVEVLIRSSGSFVMAESPTYYKCYRPVLKALQKLNADDLPFKVELVTGQKSVSAKPPYAGCFIPRDLLYKCSCAKSSDCCCNYKYGSVLQDVEEISISDKINCVLDPSQEVAMKSLLKNRIGIVQGPPGTGKTYLGVHLVKLLLSLTTEDDDDETALDGPILVLTYKNHALDEFSKHIIQKSDTLSLDGSFIRVGGRSQDEYMKKYALHNFLSSSAYLECNLAEKLKNLSQKIIITTAAFCQNCMQLRIEVVKRHFDNVQIANLLKDYSSKDKRFEKVLKNAEKIHRGIENIACVIHMVIDDHKYYSNVEMLINLFDKALEAWLPSDATSERVRDEENNKRYDFIKKAKLYERINESRLNATDIDDEVTEDPISIQKMIEERCEAAAVHKDLNRLEASKISLINTDNNPYNVETPKCMKNLGNISKIIGAKTDLNNWKYISNPWKLTEGERVHFLQAMLVKQSEYAAKELKNMLDERKMLQSQINTLQKSREIEALKRAKVVAMTITGASIRADVLTNVKPPVIIVEEAAEINEAQIIALLGEHVKHLVLIGDHKQLRPQVECFELVKKFNFDVSMMERLIENGLPYATLSTQNRMRPDISKYLKDIYPDLRDNPRVNGNPPVKCIDSNMFFWNHDFREKSGRSHTNSEEAQAVIELVKFLTRFNGYSMESITVLSAYKGQTAELRKLARNAFSAFGNDKAYNRLDIQTIDMFQGDENDIIIVSLVRCNPEKNPGFLGILNRRCVAQSRGRSGVYFLGNASTMKTAKKISDRANVWGTFLTELEKDGNFGDKLKLKCKNHEDNIHEMLVGQMFPTIDIPFCTRVCAFQFNCRLHNCELNCQPYHDSKHERCFKTVEFFYNCNKHQGEKRCYERIPRCTNPCNFLFHEDVEEINTHPCTESCEPVHEHDKCKTVIRFLCPDNGHPMMRRCYEDESSVLCLKKVSFIYKFCNFHSGIKLCHEKASDMECREQCLKLMEPCQHKCPERCQSSHLHDKSEVNCMEKVQFSCHKCAFMLTRLCYQTEADVRCENNVTFIYSLCGRHQGLKLCYERVEDKLCPEKCGLKLATCAHLCQKPCYPSHEHVTQVSECNEVVTFKHACGQSLKRFCKEKESDIVCNGTCVEVLECGHCCPLPCQPDHLHQNNKAIVCEKIVGYACSQCQSQLSKKCFQEKQAILCEAKLSCNFAKCGHPYSRKCHEEESSFKCKKTCEQSLEKCEHRCKMACGSEHSHENSLKCVETVTFAHHCGYLLSRQCNQLESSVNCTGPCKQSLPCGHKCTKECGLNHQHNYPCSEMVKYNCDSCGIELTRKCYQKPSELKCTGTMQRKCESCDSFSTGPCVKSDAKFDCWLPCAKTIQQCGHACSLKCYETCTVSNCKPCILEKEEQEKRDIKLREERTKIEIEQKKQELKKLDEDMVHAARFASVQAYEVKADSDACDEYISMKTMVMKYLTIRPGYMPKIKQIFKVHNVMANRRLLQHQMQLHDPRKRQVLCYFALGGHKAIKEYYEKGFHQKFSKVPQGKQSRGPPKYQDYINFSTVSREVNFKSEDFVFSVLICDVAIGKCKTYQVQNNIPRDNNSFYKEFDSVFIAGQDGFAQYCIYNPYQIVVTGYVTFTLEPQDKLLSKKSSEEKWITGKFQQLKLEPSREFHFMDSRETYLRMAESQFYRHNRNANRQIKDIDLYLNPDLEGKFLKKKEEFEQKYSKRESKLSQEIWTFHGTRFPSPEVIMKENFSLDKVERTVHGFGIYFSEFPDVALGYAGGYGSLLFVRVLPGLQVEASNCEKMRNSSSQDLCKTHDSHLVDPQSQNYSQMVIIQNVDQILPMFIIHLK